MNRLRIVFGEVRCVCEAKGRRFAPQDFSVMIAAQSFYHIFSRMKTLFPRGIVK